MSEVVFHFEWDADKARANLAKHEVSFPLASSVLRDPLALSMYDEEHSTQEEDRWVSLGRAANGQCLVVIHTFEELGANEIAVRIISARRANHDEIRDYEETPR